MATRLGRCCSHRRPRVRLRWFKLGTAAVRPRWNGHSVGSPIDKGLCQARKRTNKPASPAERTGCVNHNLDCGDTRPRGGRFAALVANRAKVLALGPRRGAERPRGADQRCANEAAETPHEFVSAATHIGTLTERSLFDDHGLAVVLARFRPRLLWTVRRPSETRFAPPPRTAGPSRVGNAPTPSVLAHSPTPPIS